jgi:hypothetical protein
VEKNSQNSGKGAVDCAACADSILTLKEKIMSLDNMALGTSRG